MNALKGKTSSTPGNPMTLKPSVVVYKIAKLDDKVPFIYYAKF